MYEIKCFLVDRFNLCKIRFLVTLFILFVSLIIGIILACKYKNDFSMNLLDDYGIVSFVGTGVTSSFFSRLLSIFLIMLILFICSFSRFLMPLAVVVLAFRTYLLGFNLCLMFLSYGLPGIFLSIFIILPCQLIMLFIFCSFYFLITKSSNSCLEGGKKLKLKITLCVFFLMVLCCLVETLLLLIFNASVIIVI